MLNDHFMKILVTFISIIFLGIIMLFVVSNIKETGTDGAFQNNQSIGNFGAK